MSENYDFIKQQLGPCGINCGKCFAFVDGDIHKHSNKLKELLGNFGKYAKRFVKILDEPKFSKYPNFEEFLNLLSTIECKGCRNEKCKLFKNCGVRPCSAGKSVDFCFQCTEFPCQKTNFDDNLYKRFVESNKQMKENGIENYYDNTKNQPRY